MATEPGLNIKITNAFTDGTKKSVTIGEIAASKLDRNNIQAQVTKLNNPTTREEEYPGFTTGFVSNAGANFVSVSSVEVISKMTTVIF